ncbi:sulfur oxidoreductase, partial [Limosilactobacillus fermentum]|nr:sulfur oxidoreductase [Limosilactobacillus fermentum]
MLSACGHSKQMEIKAADISDLEKNRMDVAASQ